MRKMNWLFAGMALAAVVLVGVAAQQAWAQCCGGMQVAMAAAPDAKTAVTTQPSTSSQPAKFANVRCPIMGSPINPDKVPANLTREYKGQKVAFCCGGCPPAWDKLSDAEKDAKLKAASTPETK